MAGAIAVIYKNLLVWARLRQRRWASIVET